MLFDDPALRQLKNTFEKEKVRKEGFIKATDRAFGFLEVDRVSYFIAPGDMKKVVNGDRVVAVIESDGEGKSKAIPEKIVEPYLSRFVATVLFISGKLHIIPDNPSINIKIIAEDKRTNRSVKLNNGDWVICNLKTHALKGKEFRATVDEYICAKDDPKTPWLVSLRKYDLPIKEPDDSEFPFKENDLKREDLCATPFVTIDSEHTEDMDDALYLEETDEFFKLYVAIADPTGYISQNTKENDDAAHRAFSIYLPGRDIPMLPRILSQNLCSLRENEERSALVGIMYVQKDGTILNDKTEFKLATIKSHGKLVYNKVSDFFEKVEGCDFNPNDEIRALLERLIRFTECRDQYRATHAATFKNKPDYEFVLKENGALDHIEVNHRRIANRIVEESMIVANIAAGNFLAKNLNCGIYNLHKGFDMQKKKDIIELLKHENCPFDEEKLGTLEEYNAIRRFAIEHDNDYLDSRIRKLQEFSEISIKPGPHYALGVENYATWTSPIRKYGDMVNHRLLKSMIEHQEQIKLPDEELLKIMNEARRTNRMAERDVKDWLYVEFLEPDIEKKTPFEATIFEISRGGFKATLDANGAMVFVPFSMISDDKDALTLLNDTGEMLVNNEVVKRLGDKVMLKIIEVNRKTRSIIAAPTESIGGLMLPDPYAPKKAKFSPKRR